MRYTIFQNVQKIRQNSLINSVIFGILLSHLHFFSFWLFWLLVAIIAHIGLIQFDFSLCNLTLIRESWKNPKLGTVTERVFREKSDAQRFPDIFSEIGLSDGPENSRLRVQSRTYVF